MTSVVVFEDEGWRGFAPLSLSRHVSQQIFGSSTIIAQISAMVGGETSLAGRDYIGEAASEETGLVYNGPLEQRVLLINARVNPLASLARVVKRGGDFALIDRSGSVAIAAMTRDRYLGAVSKDGTVSQPRLSSLSKGSEALESQEGVLFRFPWEIVSLNDVAISSQAGWKGGKASPRPTVSPEAEIEEHVSFDTRLGPVTVEAGARVESFTRISGPSFVGRDSVVHSALIRAGTSIGESCRVGGEVDHSIVYPFTNKAHLGFLGHSVVGSWVNLGAGSVTSDLKNTYGTMKVTRGGARVDSGMVKLGAMIGDMAKVASGTIINGGKSVGVSSHCSGAVDSDVPDFVHLDCYGGRQKSFVLTLESVIETQSRMMRRRGKELTEAKRRLIKRLYGESRKTRAAES
jgi:UDP-N-acetylglucosamine diphosphorylase / glucose-1-phosphate thymidylyltransferase / UDP-N-acetylgalactosamine diphosphorylase / glucosamine-1-phosphate N-acetyltransferase / galactosamine-1-phosphate N-acetyltransferase